MIEIQNAPIPAGKLGQFDEILKACGGYYLSTPIKQIDKFGAFRASYSFDDSGDYSEFNKRWGSCVNDFIERRDDKPHKRILRRISLWIRQPNFNLK